MSLTILQNIILDIVLHTAYMLFLFILKFTLLGITNPATLFLTVIFVNFKTRIYLYVMVRAFVHI